ncbi:hypothetical protein KOW79_002399 [Hemibagrus wyckioides]|uniref:Uncharacterized protein n=1 Tax=Hemibagrus wyckioides TaxID=337641 RepID=A0A9D3P7Q4_9TELE|nr:hypothetical protein KOW79_002399 [Hemibagrus wyckioides]
MGRRVSSKKAGHSLVNSEPLLADKGMEMKGKSTELDSLFLRPNEKMAVCLCLAPTDEGRSSGNVVHDSDPSPDGPACQLDPTNDGRALQAAIIA